MAKVKEEMYQVLDMATEVPDRTHAPCMGIICSGKPCSADCAGRDGADNCVVVELSGEYAMFSNVLTSGSAEKITYPIPTYEALRRILGAIYQKPTFNWVIDRVRVMNLIQPTHMGKLQTNVHGNVEKGNKMLVNHTFLYNVRYQVQAHIEWNYNHPEFDDDRCYRKHLEIFRRSVESPRRNPVFGIKECPVTVRACKFGEDEGAYDKVPEMSFAYLYHSMTYADEAILPDEQGFITKNLWAPIMHYGVIEYCRPQACPTRVRINRGKIKHFQKMVKIQTDDGNVLNKRLDPKSEFERKLFEREKWRGVTE